MRSAICYSLAKVILINGENGVDPALALDVDAIKKKEVKIRRVVRNCCDVF